MSENETSAEEGVVTGMLTDSSWNAWEHYMVFPIPKTDENIYLSNIHRSLSICVHAWTTDGEVFFTVRQLIEKMLGQL